MPSRNELNIRGAAVGLSLTAYPNDSKFEQKILYLEKFGTAYTETLGTSVLTTTGDLADGDQVLIGSVTYTFKTALTGVKATGLLTSTGVFADGDTVTIRGVTYTFRTTLSSPSQRYEVLIGVSAAVSLDNLKLAINGGGTNYPTAADASGMGTTWSTETVRHPYVNATTNTNTTQLVEANEFGTEANQFAITSTSTNNVWGAAKMGTVVTTEVAGVANVLNEVLLGANAAASLANLKKAVNNSATEGTDYSTGTKAHPQVTATTLIATQVTVAARNAAFDNASIATTDPVDTGTHMSWGATTLASGVRGVTAANTTTWAGNAGVSGDKNLI
jgi:hypothetical protein